MEKTKECYINLRSRLAARFERPLGLAKFSLVLSLVTLLLYHYPLFSCVVENVESGFNGVFIIATFAVLLLVANFMVYYLLLYLGRGVGRWLLALLFACNGACFYFIDTYEVLITREMMGNLFNTRMSEASGFMSWGMVLNVVLLGVVPAIYVLRRKITYGRLRTFLLSVLASLAVIVGLGVANMQNFPWIDRNATQIGSLLMPWSYTVNSIRYYHHWRMMNREEIDLPDAQIVNDDREVVVLVIGESARRDHFSLYGYHRTTNPLLEQDSVTALVANASATYTTAGVKAILDHRPAEELYEILPNYLYRAGVDVVWRTTNWGEPPLHIERYANGRDLAELYPEEDARYDEILLANLEAEIREGESPKTLVVLHTSTSHGPTYYTKYPQAFEVFTPVCTTVEMSKANRGELMNAYDNTILYTDYLLHSVIETLRSMEDVRSTMIYVSDHGESLGEDNCYMHGAPMSMAPREQYEIPFIVWCSEGAEAIKPLREVGHYHVFHSVMNFLHVESDIYDEERNIFVQ